eukprot:3288108-Alexandrium_andersonii.AAC.1
MPVLGTAPSRSARSPGIPRSGPSAGVETAWSTRCSRSWIWTRPSRTMSCSRFALSARASG